MNQHDRLHRKELLDAQESLASTLRKCLKIQQGGKLRSPQQTLNDRRAKSLQIAVDLIEERLKGIR
ncbi:MAG: hypothetical protein KDC46_00365 [Thermoleophilia bacterium]|nr:hypothetical protein [Thermoleophilia bacterium]